MKMNRRNLIKGIGAALCAGMTPTFVPALVGGTSETITSWYGTGTFQDMLNEYLPFDLLREELVNVDLILKRVTKEARWKGQVSLDSFLVSSDVPKDQIHLHNPADNKVHKIINFEGLTHVQLRDNVLSQYQSS